MDCRNVKIGDNVRVHNREGNVMLQAGYYNLEVIAVDDHSFAVIGFDKWWFYRDNGEACVGNAVVDKIL